MTVATILAGSDCVPCCIRVIRVMSLRALRDRRVERFGELVFDDLVRVADFASAVVAHGSIRRVFMPHRRSRADSAQPTCVGGPVLIRKDLCDKVLGSVGMRQRWFEWLKSRNRVS